MKPDTIKQLIISIVFLFVFYFTHAALTVDYNISSNTTWTISDSPVTVTKADFTVDSAVTLNIEQDVVVNLVPATGQITVKGFLNIASGVQIKVMETKEITVYGRIIANGTALNPVVFDEYEAGKHWSGLYFRKNDSIYKNKFVNTEFRNLNSDIAVAEQNVTFDSCLFVVDNYENRFLIRTWGGFDYLDSAVLHIKNSTFNISSDYTCSGMGCERAVIRLDGADAVIENNAIKYASSGETVTTISAIIASTSNTQPFNVLVNNNIINLRNNAAYTMNKAYGINFADQDVSGVIKNNNITVTTSMNGVGIYNKKAHLLEGNTIKVIKTGAAANNYDEIVGIYDENASLGYADLIRQNKITLQTDSTHTPNYGFTGIYMQSGKAVNNIIEIRYANSNETTRIKGINNIYYSCSIENNTVFIDHPSASDYIQGVLLNTHYNADDSVSLRNNIIAGSSLDSTYGINKDTDCYAKLGNAYNLIYGFEHTHKNMAAGLGLVTDDPLFADTAYHLAPGSPAIDAGDPAMDYSNEPMPNGGRINIGAYGNTSGAALSGATSNKTIHNPHRIMVSNCKPNPFKTYTSITINAAEAGKVIANVYDLQGIQIKQLLNSQLIAGTHTITWNGDNDAGNGVPDGIYICKIDINGCLYEQKMVLVR
jgi:hypothetical protein